MGTPETKNADTLSPAVASVDNVDANNKQPEEVDYKALLEVEKKRARDNQAAFTKSRQEISVLKKEAQVLEEKLLGAIVLPKEQNEELEKLKFSDPDAWFSKKQSYEQEAINLVNVDKTKAREEALIEVQKQDKDEQMTAWLSNNPEITLDMIQLDVPPRIHKAYEEGTLNMDEFLEKSKEYLISGNKKLAGLNVNNIKDLNKIPGGKNPTNGAVVKQNEVDSKLEIY